MSKKHSKDCKELQPMVGKNEGYVCICDETKKIGMHEVDTWLPVFSGTYGTIWETDNDEEMEIDNINRIREEKGLKPVECDDIEWDYEGYEDALVDCVSSQVAELLKEGGFIDGYKSPEMKSPREYNFRNDSIDVTFIMTNENNRRIMEYLNQHLHAFTKYIEDRYTSHDGFMSFHSNNVANWIGSPDLLTHEHKLGSVLNFILLNEDPEVEMSIYEHAAGHGVFLFAKNYHELTEGKSCAA